MNEVTKKSRPLAVIPQKVIYYKELRTTGNNPPKGDLLQGIDDQLS